MREDAMEDREEEQHTLYGTKLSETDAGNIVGYCQKHRAYITIKQMRKKECLRKECRYFRRVENPFWEERAERKAAKKQRKAGSGT